MLRISVCHVRRPIAGPCLGTLRALLSLPASQFDHVLGRGNAGNSIYRNDPLDQLGQFWRGIALQTIVRNVLHEQNPHLEMRDATPGLRSNGARRSQGQTSFDWLCDGRRVECKSSRLCWVASERTWRAQFHGIKLPLEGTRDDAEFEDLILVVHSPSKLHILKHDHRFSVSTRGTLTAACGHTVTVAGTRDQTCWRSAVSTILLKFCSGESTCEELAEIRISDAQVATVVDQINAGQGLAYMKQVYNDVPLSAISGNRRALVMERLGLAVDQLLNGSSTFSDAAYDEFRVDGRRRGRSSASVDWVRDQTRVEFKYTRLSWNEGGQRWHCGFHGIKFAYDGVRQEPHFDELWLAIYSPYGIHMFIHDGTFGVSKAGLRGSSKGFAVNVYSKKGEHDPQAALDIICSKLLTGGCRQVAVIRW
eukprot:gb/GFBE01027377.1/.p1 GENE.gb/GFBE01027377.1/~~gb/GFBE01027377.1/.p1  ORF type:complete len:421 (+),score=14.90 gb/GFBE01027377.1/:1-1263(+)